MSQMRLSMRRTRELMRRKYELGRSHREFAEASAIANDMVSEYTGPGGRRRLFLAVAGGTKRRRAGGGAPLLQGDRLASEPAIGLSKTVVGIGLMRNLSGSSCLSGPKRQIVNASRVPSSSQPLVRHDPR